MRVVLLVEDTDIVRVSLRRSLEEAGFHVIEALTGIEAVQRCSMEGVFIDVVLQDMRLDTKPEGAELGRWLRDILKKPVVAISGFPVTEEADWPYVSVLHKPVDPPALVRELDRAVNLVGA